VKRGGGKGRKSREEKGRGPRSLVRKWTESKEPGWSEPGENKRENRALQKGLTEGKT